MAAVDSTISKRSSPAPCLRQLFLREGIDGTGVLVACQLYKRSKDPPLQILFIEDPSVQCLNSLEQLVQAQAKSGFCSGLQVLGVRGPLVPPLPGKMIEDYKRMSLGSPLPRGIFGDSLIEVHLEDCTLGSAANLSDLRHILRLELHKVTLDCPAAFWLPKTLTHLVAAKVTFGEEAMASLTSYDNKIIAKLAPNFPSLVYLRVLEFFPPKFHILLLAVLLLKGQDSLEYFGWTVYDYHQLPSTFEELLVKTVSSLFSKLAKIKYFATSDYLMDLFHNIPESIETLWADDMCSKVEASLAAKMIKQWRGEGWKDVKNIVVDQPGFPRGEHSKRLAEGQLAFSSGGSSWCVSPMDCWSHMLHNSGDNFELPQVEGTDREFDIPARICMKCHPDAVPWRK